MKDSVILGTGNSRYLKSVADFKTLYPTYDDFASALVAGTLPIDLNGINTAGFQQVGDGLGSDTLLKVATAALFGLDDDAVPDDAFNLLSRFPYGIGKEYIWKKTQKTFVAETTGYKESAYGKTVSGKTDESSITLYKNYTTDDNGVITLTGPTVTLSDTYSYGTKPSVTPYIGYYVYASPSSNEVYQITSNSSTNLGVTTLSSGYAAFISKVSLVVTAVKYNVIDYVNSPDPTTYPPSVSDGYTYIPVGKIGDKVRIATGSYVGTGNYGQNNPTVLQFSFDPKTVIVYDEDGLIPYDYCWTLGMLWCEGQQIVHVNNSGTNANDYVYTYKTDNKFMFYSTGAAVYQRNTSGKTYYYLAIG